MTCCSKELSCCCKKQKETRMVLEVDLTCEKCFKKVKRVLCKFPEIRNQEYYEEYSMVVITVLSCCPEKIRDKLGCKAGKSIKRIDSLPPPQYRRPDFDRPPLLGSAPGQKPPENIQKTGSKKGAEKGSEKGGPAAESAPKPASKPAEPTPQPAPKPAEPTPARKSQQPEAQWVAGYPPGPPPQMMPVSVYYAPGYEGIPAPPCYHTGPPTLPYPYGYYGHPCPPPYYGNRCDYFSEENPAACSVM